MMLKHYKLDSAMVMAMELRELAIEDRKEVDLK